MIIIYVDNTHVISISGKRQEVLEKEKKSSSVCMSVFKNMNDVCRHVSAYVLMCPC